MLYIIAFRVVRNLYTPSPSRVSTITLEVMQLLHPIRTSFEMIRSRQRYGRLQRFARSALRFNKRQHTGTMMVVSYNTLTNNKAR